MDRARAAGGWNTIRGTSDNSELFVPVGAELGFYSRVQ